MGKYCTSCGSKLDENNKFCIGCGKKIINLSDTKSTSQKFCVNCGKQIPSGSKFCVECGTKVDQEKKAMNQQQSAQQAPPQVKQVSQQPTTQTNTKSAPVQMKPKSNTMKIIGAIIVVTILMISVFYVGFMLGKNNNDKTFGNTPGNVDISSGNFNFVTSNSIGDNGGSVSVNDNSNNLFGLNINVPEGATTEDIDFTISYADVNEINGIPEEADIASDLIKIETEGSNSWNEYKTFQKPCTVTLPYDSDMVTNEDSIRFYFYDEENQRLDSTGFISQDTDVDTITFYSGTFSSFIAIQLGLSAYETLGFDYTVDSGFRPKNDGWFIPNWGSYISSGGNCLGMTSFAKWYYAYKKSDDGTSLYNKYIEGDTQEWRDDSTAIQLASRCQLGTSGIWSSLTQEEKQWAVTKSHDVAYSVIHGLKISGEPQLIGLATRFNNGSWAEGGHAVIAYRYKDGAFDIYDPNYPGTEPGTAVRQIPFTYETGFTSSYSSGQNSGEGRQYNIFYHAGIKIASPLNAYSGLYDSAEKDFSDDSTFPTITLTDQYSETWGETPIDSDGDGIRDTTESKATISGTISGGQEEITSTLIFVSNKKFQVPVNSGSFSQEVPLYAGDNDVIILATDSNTWTNWAGYLSDTIKSSASTSSLTFTMTWSQDNCDVDLHVLEPNINDEQGRHIYYGNKGLANDGHPYLDIDNTWGYGPEHYYATDQMSLPNYQGDDENYIYGTYQFRIHYYDDDEDDEYGDPPIPTKPINWNVHVRYLAYKDPVYGTEYWEESSWGGILRTANSYCDTSNFYNSGGSWSEIYTLYYDQPNPEDYGVPSPPQNQLPT